MIGNEEKEDLQTQLKEEQQVKSDTKVITDGGFEESASLLDSNFDPINFTEFVQAISNTYKQRRSQFYESFLKDRKYKSSSEDQKVERDLKLIELYSKYNELMQSSSFTNEERAILKENYAHFEKRS